MAEVEKDYVIELARFKVRPDQEADFLAKRPAMVAAARRNLPGLRRIELVRLESGEWMDIIVWTDRASADRAPDVAGKVPEFSAWLAHVAEDTGMDYGSIHDSIAISQDQKE